MDLEERLQQLESRLQVFEDDKAIREVLARYGYNADRGRREEYVHLYTEDGVLDLSHGPDNVHHALGVDEPLGREVVSRMEGHDAIRGFMNDPNKHARIEGTSLHVHGMNLKTQINGDEAIAESYNVTLVRQGPKWLILNAGADRWTLEKVDGSWLIKECKRRRPGTEEFTTFLVTQA